MDRNSTRKDQFLCDKRASWGADFTRAESEYISQLVRTQFFSLYQLNTDKKIMLVEK